MKTGPRLLAVLAASLVITAVTTGTAVAQTIVNPTNTPVENRSPLGPLVGPISFAVLFMLGAAVLVVVIVFLYMRYAPRFARDEESARVVRADRVLPGQEPPRRAVDLSQAVPVVVQPPVVPALAAAPAGSAAPSAPQTPAASAPAPTAPPAQRAAAPAPAEAATAPARPTPAAEAAPAEAETAPAAAETAPAGVEAAPAPAEAATETEAAPTPEPAQAAPAASPAEHVEVTMDQETYESTLAELLASGTDRRIAEGKARRAGMLAAKKKAGGG
jgi:hypothetical protein